MMTNLLFNRLTAIGKRFAMVLTMLVFVGVGQVWGETIVSWSGAEREANTEYDPTTSQTDNSTAKLKSECTLSTEGTGWSANSYYGDWTNEKCIYVTGLNLSGYEDVTLNVYLRRRNGTCTASFYVSTDGITYAATALGTKTLTNTLTPYEITGISSNVKAIKIFITGGSGNLWLGTLSVEGTKAAAVPIDVTLHYKGTSTTISNQTSPYTLPTTGDYVADACDGWEFAGWYGSEYAKSATEPTYITQLTSTGDAYAVYSHTETTQGSGTEVTIIPDGLSNNTISHNQSSYTITTAKNTGKTEPAYVDNGADIRIYAKGSITISNTTNITKIVFNISTQGKKRLAPITASVGSIGTQASGDATVTWTGEAKSVTFTVGDDAEYGSDGNTKAGQLCFTTITATTSGGGSTTTTYYHSTPECNTEPSPSLSADETELAFNEVTVNSPQQLTFTLSGSNLTADAILALSGTNADLFSVSQTSVTPTDGSITETIRVTYTPDAKASHSATLTISSTGAKPIQISLSGTGVAQTAEYNVEHYRQNIVDDGYTLCETETSYGEVDASVTPAVKTYEGFTAPSTKTVTIASDGTTVVEYQYTRNSYTLTWNVNGGNDLTGIYTSGSVKYEATITKPTDPTREGYTFAGWSPEVTATMPAANTTYTAQWTEKTAPNISWSAPTCTVTIASPSNELPTLNNPNSLSPIVYSSSATDVATIDDQGRIILKSAGETIITAAFAETDDYKSAEVTYTLTVVESDNCRWIETDIEDIEYGDEVVITMTKGQCTYALPNAENTSSAPQALDVSTYIDGNELNYDEDDAGDFKWIVEKTDGNYIFHPSNNGTLNLYCNSDDNGIRVGSIQNAKTNQVFSVSGNYLLNNATSRYLGVSSNTTPHTWRCYLVTTGVIKDQTLKFYKRVCLSEGQYWVKWMVAGQEYTAGDPTTFTDGQITAIPADPADDAIGNCANKFMGWSETNIGSTPDDANLPTIYTSLSEIKTAYPSITSDKTFYAVFATASSGGGENTTEVFATTDIVSSTGVTSGYTISALAKKESGYYEDGTGEKRYVQVMKSDVSTPMITNIPISITVTAELGGGSTKDDLTNSVYAIWLDKDGEELGDAVFLTDEITAKTGSNFTANLPIANATSAYGVRVYHQKESGYNVRYYGISLSYKYNNVTYSNYVTQCCTDWTPTLTYSKTTLDSESSETAIPTIKGNTHNAPVSFESSNASVLKVDANNGTITAFGAGKATITATWEKTGDYCDKSITTDEITVNGNFLVTFYANDGSGNTTTQQIPSNTATALNANTFQRNGYTFQGWATSASGAKEYDDKQEVTLSTSGLDLYAVWQVKTYNITIGTITGNGTITTSPTNSANYDAQVTITATPAAHYTFASVTVTRDDNSQTVVVGGNKFTMPASDVTITAVFTENEKFAINYAIPTGGGTLTDNAPTSIYIDGSITLPGIKDGTISSEYSCEEFIGWTTNPANHEAAGLKPEPFYNTGASFSDVSEDITFYPVYSRPGAGVGGTVTLTAEEMEGWATAQSYGTLRELVTCHGTWKTTGVKTTGNPIQLNATNNPYVEFPELQGNITQVVLNATNGSNATLTSGTFTLKTLDGQTTIASASVNNSGVCTLTVTGSYKTARLYSSSGTARITNIAITYGPPAIISTTLDCSSDVDDCTIIYDLNESFLAAGTQILGSCNNSKFKFSEVGTYTICSEPQANEYKLIGWNNQCDGKGSLTYTPGQEITSLPQNIITLYAQWAPEVIVHDSYEDTKVYPTAMGGSITLNSGQYACDPKKYDFIGWTTDDPQLWQQNITPPTLLTDNGDGTVTFTPEEPSQVYAVYAIEDLANSDAFKLSSIVGGKKYYAKYHADRAGHMIATTEVAEALTFGKEQSTGSTYKIFFVNPDGEKEYIYSNGDLQTSSAPLETWAWTISGTAGNYTFTSAYGDGKCLSTNGNSFSVVLPQNLSVVFDMEVSAEYKYIAKTNCSENVTITFVPGNGTMEPSDNPVTAKTGDIIELPTCEYEGWTFEGWVTENIELTEFRVDPSRLYIETYEVGNSDVTLYAYYTQTPTPADFDGTTSGIWKMYTEVSTDVYKYALSHGSSSPNTLSSTEYCPNATEWIFTNTGEANVYYIQDEDNLYLTPELDDTQLYFTSTPFPWKIVKIDDSDEYRIYKYDTRSDAYERLIMSNQSGLFYHSAKANEGNSDWHHVTIGGCTNPVYTTDPQPSKIISLVGSPMITSTIGQTVKASQKLQLVIKDMDANADVTIAADGLKFYDTDNNVVNSLQTGPNGSLTATFTVAYTPTVADNQIVKPAITVTCGSTVRTFYNVSCRSLPADFAIVAKVGNLWYALPSQGLNSTDALVGYPVEVDNQNDPTAVTAVLENADWSLRQVYAASHGDAQKDRFEQYGANIMFENNASPAKMLNASVSDNYLLTGAEYSNYYGTNPGLYEWTPTTTDLETYTLTNAQRTDRTLNVATNTVFGVHSDNKATTEVRFLPIQNRYTPVALQVVEWKENSVVIMYNGNSAQTASVSVNGAAPQETVLSSAQRDIAVYELAATGLAANPTQRLSITIGTEKVILPIPYIISSSKNDIEVLPGTTIAARQEVAKVSDLVILKGATLTAAGASTNLYKFRNVTIYGGGKLVIPSDKGFGVNTLTLRIGGMTEDNKYDYVYPEFVLNGKYTSSSGKINLDYVTTKEQYYTFVAPFDVKTKDIKYPVDIYGSNVAANNTGSFEFQYYDGAARATGATGWKTVEEGADGATLEPGQGYTFLGMPKKINGTRQKYGIHRIPMSVSATDATKHEKTDQTISVAPHPSAKNNNSGWNLIGNPYMATISELTNEDIQVGKLVHTTDANDNWTGGWHWDEETVQSGQRFLVIPSNDGQSYEAVQASNATLPAFKNFFVQISNEGANALIIPVANRVEKSLAPARYAEEQPEKDVEVAIVLEQDEAHSDQMDFLINNIYTEDFERDADFTKMMNATNLNLYGVHPYDNLSFVAMDKYTAQQSVAIGYQVPAAGEYTLRMSDKPYVMFERIEALYVTDHEMSPEVTTDIMSEPYRFTVAKAETNHTRFTVSITLKANTEDDVTTILENVDVGKDKPIKFFYQDKLYILRNGIIYDAMGKQVQTINK